MLNAPIPHAPRALVSTEMVARALGELGRFADILRAAAMAIGPIRGTRMLPPHSVTSRRRHVRFLAMGASHVLKGNQRAGGNNLATHLMNEFDNEHRGKMYGCNLYLGDGYRRLGIGGPCMNLGRTQTKSHVHPTPRSCADITYNRSTRYSGLEDYFGQRRPPFMKVD